MLVWTNGWPLGDGGVLVVVCQHKNPSSTCDVLHSESRDDLLTALEYSTGNARFRQHDELRYSLWSAFQNTKTWKDSVWHVVTADVPDPEAFDDNQRLGLVPQWLDIECSWARGANGEPPVYLYHDSEVFHLTSSPGHVPSLEEVETWRNAVLPTFNSMAVESQLPHLDPEVVSENIVYLNDNQFLTLPLPPSAFHSPLYGPVFRLDTFFMIQGDPSGDAPGGGEWCSLGWSAHILNQRFGSRARAYVRHNARSFSLPLMHEAALTFGEYFALTPMSQFRSAHDVGGEFEVNTIFSATHFVMEWHREALLWSHLGAHAHLSPWPIRLLTTADCLSSRAGTGRVAPNHTRESTAITRKPARFAVRLIQRYAYAITKTPSVFFGVSSAEQGKLMFSWLPADLALLCVNDDLDDGALNVTQGDVMLRRWFQDKWPERLDYEK
ncbi:hypothetical protein B0H10DRAFT_2208855 [Mycena sp. CBHHK59/15]|nr:hypothetical protein B0H10DRAFT_2208855 [Mycena sp. CBHHK59/15]